MSRIPRTLQSITKMMAETTVYNRLGAREGNRGIRVHHSVHSRLLDLGFPSMTEAVRHLLDCYEKRQSDR